MGQTPAARRQAVDCIYIANSLLAYSFTNAFRNYCMYKRNEWQTFVNEHIFLVTAHEWRRCPVELVMYTKHGTMTRWNAALFLVADFVATLRKSIFPTERYTPSPFVSCNAQNGQKRNSPQEKQARASPAGGGGPPVGAGVGGGGVTPPVKGRG